MASFAEQRVPTASRDYPPGPKPHFLIGNFPLANRDPLRVFTGWAREFGDLFHYRAGWVHIYFLNHPALIESVLVNQHQNFTKERTQQRMKILVGEGLITSEGKFHLRQRRLAQPAFHRSRISAYASTMVERATRVCDRWELEAKAQRDIALAELTRAPVHICHMSAAESLRAVREGKHQAVKVTCEVAPHHFTLTDEALSAPVSYDTNVKMNPPLRSAADRDAMVAGIADGSVDAIATDHAPHHYDEKRMEFDQAPFGIVGLETCVAIALDRLVHAGLIRLPRLVELLSVNPARILNVPGGSLAEGAAADITVLAPDLQTVVDAAKFRSRSRNTPFSGWQLHGAVAATIVGGRTVYVNDSSEGARRLE